MSVALEERIVNAILADFTDRRGLRQGWDGIDEDIQLEILESWKDKVRLELRREELLRGSVMKRPDKPWEADMCDKDAACALSKHEGECLFNSTSVGTLLQAERAATYQRVISHVAHMEQLASNSYSKSSLTTVRERIDEWLMESPEAASALSAVVQRETAKLREAAGIMHNCCQILDVVKPEWAESWSEWDQSVRDSMTKWLTEYYKEKETRNGKQV